MIDLHCANKCDSNTVYHVFNITFAVDVEALSRRTSEESFLQRSPSGMGCITEGSLTLGDLWCFICMPQDSGLVSFLRTLRSSSPTDHRMDGYFTTTLLVEAKYTSSGVLRVVSKVSILLYAS